jgi:YVTN family beta-propeller protein/VCBS repeat-containing protein
VTVTPSAADEPRPKLATSDTATVGTEQLNPLARLLSAFGLPGLPGDQEPTLWTVLAWVRREIVGAFFNQSPTAHPVQVSVGDDGRVKGTLGVVDPDGDPVYFTVDHQPAHGEVTISADGTYTYVPVEPDSTGDDTFVVTVRDQGLRLLSKAGVTTVTVSVRYGEQPVVGVPAVNTPDQVSGQVSGSLGVTDPNSDFDGFNYTFVDKPRYGTVDFDAATGKFVYTPSEVGRIGAVGYPGLTDSFSVAVSNSVSPAVVVSVTDVAVQPGTVTVTQDTVDSDVFPFGMAISKDGSRAYLANIDDKSVVTIDLRTGAVSAPIAVGADPLSLTVSGDGKRLYVLNSDDTVRVIDTVTAAVVGGPIAVGNDATAIAMSPDGRRAYVSNSGDDTVSVIDTATATVVRTIAVGGDPMGLAISADNRYVYVANSDAGSISVIDTWRGRVVKTATIGDTPVALALNSDGSRLYVADAGGVDVNGDGKVEVLDTKTLKAVSAPIQVGDYPTGLALSVDGSQLYVANALSDQVSVIDTSTFEAANIAVASAPTSVATVTGPTGTFLLVAHADFYDVTPGAVSMISLNGSQLPSLTSALVDTNTTDGKIVAVSAAAGATAPAATHVTPTRDGEYTQGFNVTNLTGQPIVLMNQNYVYGTVFPSEGRASGPLNGAVLQPGATQHFELAQYVWGDNVGTLSYYQPATGRTYEVILSVRNRQNPLCSGGPCEIDNSSILGDANVIFYDKSGTTYTISASKSDDQVAALNALCGSSNAKCSFTSTRSEDTYSSDHPVGGVVLNPTNVPISKSLTVSDTTSTTTNLKITAKAGFEVLKVIKAELSTEYGKAWTDTHQFGETMGMTVAPGTKAWFTAQNPVTRYYGDMTITVGKTTILVKDMYVDSPRPSGTPLYTPHVEELGKPV